MGWENSGEGERGEGENRVVVVVVFNAKSIAQFISGQTGSSDSLLVDCRTRDRKVASSSSGGSGGRIFFFRVNFAC